MTRSAKDLVASAMLALLAVLAWPLAPWSETEIHRIAITATGAKDARSQGSEVWLTGLPDGLDFPELLAGRSTSGGWEMRDGVAVSYRGQPSTLRFEGPLPGGGAFTFVRHGWSGEVTIEINGTTVTENLFDPAPDGQPLTLSLRRFPAGTVAATGRWPVFLTAWLATALAIFLALKVLARMPAAAQYEERSSYARDTLRHALPALAIFVVVLLGTWPARTVASAFVAMMQETGPYDIVVLHNVEGISTLTLEWIKQRTGAALVLFLHNYHLVCPQIELLRDFRDHCENDQEGRGCVGCFSHVVDARKAKMARAVIEIMDRTRVSGTAAERIVRSTAAHGYGWTRDVAGSLRDMARRKAPGSLAPRWRRSMDALDRKSAGIELWSRAFRRWRPENAARVNACADAIITVSDRERDQLAARGIAAALMTTVHPGFDFHVMAAERRRRYEAKTRYDGPLRLGFLGYAIPSKGLELLIEALADAGPWAREMELWIVCRHDERLHRRLARLGDRLAAIRWIDGYSREELPEILAGIDLGIIPSICSETYSITAYEFTMAGVPVVMSDSVGFEELVDKPDFRFRRGDRAALRDTLQRLVADRRRIAEYWEGADRIPSLDDHLARFLAVVETARSRAGQDASA